MLRLLPARVEKTPARYGRRGFFASGQGELRLTRALLASLAIHLVLFLTWRPVPVLSPPTRGEGSNGQTVAAVLVAGKRLPATDGKGDGAVPILTAPAPAPRMPATRRAAVRPEAPLRQPNAEAATALVRGEGVTPPVQPALAAAAVDSPSQESIARYRLDLAREARRFKRYPPLARQRGWEGIVVVSIVAVPGGIGPNVAVDRSSGFDLLDEEALAMVTRAVQTSPLPDGLAGKRFTIALPIHYSLED